MTWSRGRHPSVWPELDFLGQYNVETTLVMLGDQICDGRGTSGFADMRHASDQWTKPSQADGDLQLQITVRNHAHRRYKLYPLRYNLHGDFTRLKAEWKSLEIIMSGKQLLSICIVSCFYTTDVILPYFHIMWNIGLQDISHTSICHGKCSTCSKYV